MLFRLGILFLLVPFSAYAQAGLAGHWEGTLPVPSGPSQLVLDIDKNARSEWIASLSLPQAQVSGLRVTNLRLEWPELRFESPEVPNQPAFALTWKAGKFTGSVSVKGYSIPFEMTRTGDAKVELPPSNPAVPKELEGDWEGAFALPGGGTRPIAVHFKNQLDQTVAATLDSPSQGIRNLWLSIVELKGDAIYFALRGPGNTTNGSYKGAWNRSASELTGEWSQKQKPPSAPLPLVLKKKQS